jgi:aminopeptidase N
VNDQGSGDMYPKGGEMLHTIRQIVGDDAKWRDILRGLQRTFRHQTVMGRQIEEYVSRQAGIDLSKVFDQYLRTTMVPAFEYRLAGDTLVYRWANVVPGFDMPLRVTVSWPDLSVIHPTTSWQRARVKLPNATDFRVDQNFYVVPTPVDAPVGSARP